MWIDFSTRERVARTIKDAVKSVVVAGKYRIELVIMTARTARAQAKKRSANVVDRIIDRKVEFLVARAKTS